ncbi:MAG: serine/threonine-protein kinase, partial [Planctomycetaceae bacterium]
RVLHEEPIPLRNLDAAIPRDLERIVLRCLEKSPQRRYGSAAELAADLEAFLNGRPVAARRSGFLNLAARALRDTRHATVMQSQGLLLMVMGVVLLVQHVIAHWMLWNGVTDRSLHGLVWLSAYPLWFVMVRRFWRQTGPSNHVERQIVQIWIGGIVMIWGVLGLETWLGLPIMTLAPLIALTGGSLFLVTARLVSGRFYLFSAALYFCAVLMALLPDYAVLILGFAVFCGYFIHGWTFHRAQRRAAQ